MRTIPMKEELVVEFKSDIKKYSDTDLVDELLVWQIPKVVSCI